MRAADSRRVGSGIVRPLPFAGDDRALLEAMKARNPSAATALVDRYGRNMERVLRRVLGPDDELADVLHDAIVSALENAHRVRDPSALKAWLTRVAVFSARAVIRRRRRRAWLTFRSPSDLADVTAPDSAPESLDAIRGVYAILAELRSDERVAFSLRFVDGMELVSVAEALDVSLATVKRILRRAEQRFVALARRHPAVLDAIGDGTRFKEAP